MPIKPIAAVCGAAILAVAASPQHVSAQDTTATSDASAPAEGPAGAGGPPASLADSVFDDTWINVGFGVAYGPSYTGSDDYVINPLPVLQGSVGGVDIAPRPAGVALDFIKDKQGKPSVNLGPVFRFRNDRANQIEDPVVELAGELDNAIELGVSGGVSFPGILGRFDSLTVGADVRWDVAGAHNGMVIDPSVTYSTPLNRGTFASLSLSTTYVSDDFAEYYFTVNPAQSAATGLPTFDAEGGFTSYGVTTLVGVDLDGNALNGGLNAVVIGGYSRLTGDAADTPFTSVRGSKDQFFVGVGLGYTF
ncbi:MipA/OmpV family protein [Altererythrobacter sp. RZ02]|uniref:MipA/OmpV family protein n=1 Tax=Pontixanthobacter rizhaonensis TaxID=2730337 RepID=A0A848QSW7_9SPHN|nr:MipA/OmpV family protein [Pontixanthobacter rizhaonensis]NMW32208.1 MipA/OmpV family protein [Pontixanthobacter rizhaonensis]